MSRGIAAGDGTNDVTHAEIVGAGAGSYVAHLRALPLQGALRGVADKIIHTIENAGSLGPALSTSDVLLTVADLRGLTPDEKLQLHNPWLPGYGEPEARLLIIGTEHAFDFWKPRPKGPSSDACFAVADCALHALWLADGSTAPLAEHLSGQLPHCTKAFSGHRHPYEFLYPVPPGHMWRRLSRMMRVAGLALDDCAAPKWGGAAYLFELSDRAAAGQRDGALPSIQRREFLPGLLESLRHARVLVFHGRWRAPDWDAIRLPLAAAFLGVTQPPWQLGKGGDFRWAAEGDRLAVLMQSPTRRGPTNEFLDSVGQLIGPYLIR